MPHFIDSLAKQVHSLHMDIPLLNRLDRLQPASVVKLASGEFEEYSEELVPEVINIEKARDELSDVGVLLLAAFNTLTNSTQPSRHIMYLNGFGKHSGAIESTKELVEEFASSPNLERDLPILYEALSRYCSIAIHSPAGETIVTDFYRTLRKVRNNYPSPIYTDINQVTGERIEDDQLIEYHAGIHGDMRKLRRVKAANGTPLKPSDWQPHYEQIIDRNNPEAAAKFNADLARYERQETASGLLIPSENDVDRFAAGREVEIFNAQKYNALKEA